MLVVFTYNNGRTSQMQKRYAEILRKLRRGNYGPLVACDPKPELENVDELQQLRNEADLAGIEYHHRAGVPKLRELLGK